MNKSLDLIEEQLYRHASNMSLPTIEEDLGVLLFEATFYKYSQNEAYKEKTLNLLDKAIDKFSSMDLPSGFFEGFEGIFWVIHYLHKCGIIPDEDMLDDMKPFLLQSLQVDFNVNGFDPIHGNIGKLQYILSAENHAGFDVEIIIDNFLDSLERHNQGKDGFVYWFDQNEPQDGLVNMGMAHGITAVLTFLSRLKELGLANDQSDRLVNGILKSLNQFKNPDYFDRNFPDHYSVITNMPVKPSSRLAWCYGDLSNAYALLYTGLVYQDEQLQLQAVKVVNDVVNRGVTDSKIDHFDDYSFMDTAFCHGLSGIVYILSKINNILNDPMIEKRISYWENELHKNLAVQLQIAGDIYYPWYRQDESRSFILDRCSLLTGHTGTGLVLLSRAYKQYDWSNIFQLY
ncbi:MAG: lanthionine synthetase LanC family protein [Bacteroidota bacterium]